ncbi:MAG: hypothetical protein ACPIOQ_01075, partial [Promethearchaeia archaeon]
GKTAAGAACGEDAGASTAADAGAVAAAGDGSCAAERDAAGLGLFCSGTFFLAMLAHFPGACSRK